jgi:hypothetical protein
MNEKELLREYVAQLVELKVNRGLLDRLDAILARHPRLPAAAVSSTSKAEYGRRIADLWIEDNQQHIKNAPVEPHVAEIIIKNYASGNFAKYLKRYNNNEREASIAMIRSMDRRFGGSHEKIKRRRQVVFAPGSKRTDDDNDAWLSKE